MGVQPKKPTVKGPADWFTGDVWIDSIVQADGHSTLNVGTVPFTPRARTAWHSHEAGQALTSPKAAASPSRAARTSSSSGPGTFTSHPTARSTGTALTTSTS